MQRAVLSVGEVLRVALSGNTWLSSWHEPLTVPRGTQHGAAAVCVTDDQGIVLVTNDGIHWDTPGGRQEPHETDEQTMRREVLEEACASVRSSRLLGYSRGECVGGREEGLVLIRSLWRAEVDVRAWLPRFETIERRIETPQRALEILCRENLFASLAPLYRRWFIESGFGYDP
jgi:8-oxo-dGTP pyrophosphatase MutT (NUDIX family)